MANDTIAEYGTSDDYGTAEVQNDLLSLLKTFHIICITNGIEYSLGYGTLLGAIRHDGFIPWDDDADVMLTRDNFERFLSVAKQSDELSLMRLLWIYRLRQPQMGTPATVDLFVVDNVPDSKVLRALKLLAIKVLQGTLKGNVDYGKYPLRYRICLMVTHALGRLISEETAYRLYEMASCIGNKKRTRHVGVYNNLFRAISRLHDADLMDEIVQHRFEDTHLCVTRAYDRYLTQLYGDYMTPPDPAERASGDYLMVVNGQSMQNNSKHI